MRKLLVLIFFIISGYQAFSFDGNTPSIVSTFFLVIMTLPMFMGLYEKYRLRAIISWLALGLFALTFEALAIKTGWPYGFFSYGDDLGLMVFNSVPIVIALAWPIIIYSAFVLTNNYKKSYGIIITLFTVVFIDMAIDPASTALGFWNWENSNGFYGVPWVNFLGWFLSGFIGVLIVKLILQEFKIQKAMHWSIIMFFGFFTGVNIASSLFIPAIFSTLVLLKAHLLWKKI